LRKTGDDSVLPWRMIFSQKRRYNEEQLHFYHILCCLSDTGYEFQRSKMVNLPTLQTIHRHFRSWLKEYEDELTKSNELPAYRDRTVQQHPLLSSGVCLAIDAISCPSTFLNAYAVKESEDPSMFLVNREPCIPMLNANHFSVFLPRRTMGQIFKDSLTRSSRRFKCRY
jgi:hypothetical protein